MKLSTKGRYGTRVLLDLALHSGEGPVQLKDVAARERISLPYLEQIIGILIAAGLVRSMRGARGGVWLARSPDEVKLSEVIGVLEGSIAPVDCVDDPTVCSRSEFCVSRELWSEMKVAMDRVLESTTLQDLVERHNKWKGKISEEIYQI